MTPFILYQLKVAFCLGLFMGLYYLLLRKETFHFVNRLYLVGSLLISIIIPFIHIPDFGTENRDALLTVINPVVVSGAISGTYGQTVGISWLAFIYKAIAALFMLYLIYQVLRLVILVSRHQGRELSHCLVFQVPHQKQSFSFLNYIFIGTADNEDQILLHEMAHVKQLHTIDILLLQIIKIFQWFNPFIYLAEKAIKETHEYLADEAVMEQNGQPERYRMLLVTQAFGVQPGIFNFFNYSIIKNRLIMITRERSLRRSYIKYFAALPLLFAALVFSGRTGLSQTPESKPKPQEKEAVLPAQPSDDEEPNFVYVEEEAQFQGGNLENFREWVQKNLVYPPDAVSNKIQGKIVLQFAVNSSGKVCNTKILRGVDPLLDNEAIRVVNLSPDWVPAKQGGKNVKQQFVFPVVFSLTEDKPRHADPTNNLKFQGAVGDEAMMKFREWIQKNVVYPPEAKAKGIQGEVRFTFTVNPSGKVSDVSIYQGVHPLLDDEILKVVRLAPDWEPFPSGWDKPVINLMIFTFKLQ